MVSGTVVNVPDAAQLQESQPPRLTQIAGAPLGTGSDATGPELPRRAPDLAKTVPICFQLGWTMAKLYTDLPSVKLHHDQLCSEHELDLRDRINLEMTRLVGLVERLNGEHQQYAGQFEPDIAALCEAWWGKQRARPPRPPRDNDIEARAARLKVALRAFNISVLTRLTNCGPEVELAYQLGRSLRDAVNPPAHGVTADGDRTRELDAMERVQAGLERQRIGRIKEWVTMLAPQFPKLAAKVVSSSLGRWSDFALVALSDDGPGRLRRKPPRSLGTARALYGDGRKQVKEELAAEMLELLLSQGDVWFSLLVGEQTTTALLTPEAYVAAGDAALRRMGRIVGKTLLQLKWTLLAVVAVVAVIGYESRQLGDAGHLFTSIGAGLGALGLTAKGVSAAISKAAADAGKPIFGLEEVEAMACAVTTLPPLVTVTHAGVRYLRLAGIAPGMPLGAI